MKRLLMSCLLFWSSILNAQVILSAWEVSGQTGFGISPFEPAFVSSGIIADSMIRGTGMGTSGTAASNAWGGNQLTEQSDSAAAIAGDWLLFALRADSGYVLSITEISAYNIRRSATGADSGLWQYKLGAGSWSDIGNPIFWGSNTTASGNAHSSISLLTFSELQKVPADTVVWFRLLLWGASGSIGTWYINNQSGYDLQILGDTQVSSLPVSWLYSRIRKVSDMNVIEWATAQEINNSHFDIEEAGPDGNFYPIGRVEGAGNSSETRYYSFSLFAPSQPRFYRIRQNDYDGKFDYSPVFSTEHDQRGQMIFVKCWPNPAAQEVHVLRTDAETNLRINVFDNTGMFVCMHEIHSGTGRINVSMLSEGVYWLEALAEGKDPEIFKIWVRRE